MEKPKIDIPWIDDLVYFYYRLILPSVLLAVLIVGHRFGVADNVLELCSFVFGLCIKAVFGKRDQ